MPYYITIGGGVLTLDDKIIIKDEYESCGSLNSAYVSEGNANVLTYLLSFVIPGYEREKISDLVYENEDNNDYEERGKLYFNSSLDSAVLVAYKKALKEININSLIEHGLEVIVESRGEND